MAFVFKVDDGKELGITRQKFFSSSFDDGYYAILCRYMVLSGRRIFQLYRSASIALVFAFISLAAIAASIDIFSFIIACTCLGYYLWPKGHCHRSLSYHKPDLSISGWVNKWYYAITNWSHHFQLIMWWANQFHFGVYIFIDVALLFLFNSSSFGLRQLHLLVVMLWCLLPVL